MAGGRWFLGNARFVIPAKMLYNGPPPQTAPGRGGGAAGAEVAMAACIIGFSWATGGAARLLARPLAVGAAAVLAAAVLGGCQATVQAQPELSRPGAGLAAVTKTDLRVGFYVHPSVRRYVVNESWAQFQLGAKIETQADEWLPRAFKEVRRLNAFPPTGGAADELDAIITIDRPEGGFQTQSLFTHTLSAGAEFGLYTPDAKAVRALRTQSSASIYMGSLDPSENVKKSYEAADLIAKGVVVNFLRDLPVAELTAAVEAYKTDPARLAARRPGRAGRQGAYPSKPLALKFKAAAPSLDDVAVIIGNADYTTQGRDIPDVVTAHADAASFKHYALAALGIREGNIIDLRDATSAQLARVFGTERTPRGQLHDWTRPGRSHVWVYYAGHGAPAGAEGSASLVPTDADGARIDINGYPLQLLYGNLAKLPARSVTVVLEACFSGISQAGSVMPASSGIHIVPKTPRVPANLTVISAGAADQIASWEKDRSSGLFTKYFLTGLASGADKPPYGNADGQVGWDELRAYLDDTLTYYARRYYGRDQKAQIVVGIGK